MKTAVKLYSPTISHLGKINNKWNPYNEAFFELTYKVRILEDNFIFKEINKDVFSDLLIKVQ